MGYHILTKAYYDRQWFTRLYKKFEVWVVFAIFGELDIYITSLAKGKTVEVLGILGLAIIGLLVIVLIILLVMVPIFIAKSRGVSGSELTTIKILSWVGLLIGITWIIALILALVYKPKKWIDKDQGASSLDLDALGKLYELKKKGVLTNDEYNKEKAKLM